MFLEVNGFGVTKLVHVSLSDRAFGMIGLGDGDDKINFEGFSDSINGELSKVYGEAGDDDITASWNLYGNDYYLDYIKFYGGTGKDTLNGKPLNT